MLMLHPQNTQSRECVKCGRLYYIMMTDLKNEDWTVSFDFRLARKLQGISYIPSMNGMQEIPCNYIDLIQLQKEKKPLGLLKYAHK